MTGKTELLSQVIYNAPNYIFWKDSDFVYRGCNLNFARLVGVNTPDDVIGKTDDDMPWGKFTGHIYKEEDRKIISTGESILNKEVPMLFAKDAQEIVLSISKVPLFDDKKIIGIMGIFIDITDRILAEKREKAAILESVQAKAKADAEEQLRQVVMILTGSIAHDLRSPISVLAMKGSFLNEYLPILIGVYDKAVASQLIIEDKENIPKRMKEHLAEMGQKIHETTKEMHNFIDITLQTLSKALSSDLTREDLVVCSMWHCIHNTLHRYPFAGQQRELIKWDQKDFNFMGNELLMIRVFFNLIKNSLEQIEKNGRGEIFITTETGDVENTIRFKDTAGGAAPEIVDNLFSGYRTTKEKGTGVGLAFCKITMENFGANISCHSVYGEYIEFILTFPAVKSEKTA